jgi:signal transduction histidine kinase
MNEVIHEFKNVRIEKEIHYQYLQMIIEHINVALICFGEDGTIELVNQAAMDLFRTKQLRNIDAIRRLDKKLLDTIHNADLEKGILVKMLIEGEMVGLSVKGTNFKIKEKPLKLVSLQDIKSELDEQELESWQKLIRVLTHEIMNSVTPVSSLSSAINEMLENDGAGAKNLTDLDEHDRSDMLEGLKTIEERSKGLLNFVGTYKNLTRLPKPSFTEIRVLKLLQHIKTLMKTELGKNNISLQIVSSEKDPRIHADHEMIERVLINLILNAMDAVREAEKPKIRIAVGSRNHQTTIEVKDNGRGIVKENIDKIFIPFFTTKKQGSGIGLSLARQIMRLHKGSISVKSEPGKFTVFTLRF